MHKTSRLIDNKYDLGGLGKGGGGVVNIPNIFWI